MILSLPCRSSGGGKAPEGDHGQIEMGALEPLFGFIDRLGGIGNFCLADTDTGTLGHLAKWVHAGTMRCWPDAFRRPRL